MEGFDQKLASQKEKRIRDASLKLAEQSTRESQRLHAIKTAFTSKLRSDAIRQEWRSEIDTECGAVMELSDLVLPFIQFHKKDYRRACYFIIQTGSQIQDTELFIISKDVVELKIQEKFRFEKISSNFNINIMLYGLNLPEKQNLKKISPRSQFKLWAQTKLTLIDMTNRINFHSLQLTSDAPSTPRIYGTLSCKLAGAIPVLCETVYEGFVNVLAEHETGPTEWILVWVTLKNSHLRGFKDPRTRTETLFDIEVTGELNISQVFKGRQYSFQLRDFAGRTILAANCKKDMDQCISKLKMHKQHLKRWGRLLGNSELDETNIEGTPHKAPWSSNFLGVKANKSKRRSRSLEFQSPNGTDSSDKEFSRRSRAPIPKRANNPGQVLGSKIIAEIVDQNLRKNRRRSKSIETPTKNRDLRSRHTGARPPVLPDFDADETFELDEISNENQDLFIENESQFNSPKSLPYRQAENKNENGPTSLPNMMNRLKINSNPQNSDARVLRTSTKIQNSNIRSKYSSSSMANELNLSPISSPDNSLRSNQMKSPAPPISPISPMSAARLLRQNVKETRASYSNAIRNRFLN